MAKGSEEGRYKRSGVKMVSSLGEQVDDRSLVLIVLLLEMQVSIRSEGQGRKSRRFIVRVLQR